jgi:hypothetical protein
VEERHFRSAYAKHKDDIRAISECVKTKSLKAVVRFYFVEEGARKKAERERRRELELLRLSRTREAPSQAGVAASASAAGGSSTVVPTSATVASGGASASELSPSRASTPFSQGGCSAHEAASAPVEQRVPLGTAGIAQGALDTAPPVPVPKVEQSP